MAPKNTTIPVWRGNLIAQEEKINDDELLYSWALCKWNADPEDLPDRYIHDNLPSARNLATHLSACMDYAFEQEDFLKMFRRVQARM